MKHENLVQNGGQLLVKILHAQKVERLFCVPGESYLPVLDALLAYPILPVICRQEGGAAMMAEATGKLTGKPGICFVTRGPGATNAAAGLHVAAQDSTPMILFIGQAESSFRDREAFQEIDYRQMFKGVAKWVGEIDSPGRIAEFVYRAFRLALGGRSGPVVLSLAEDILYAPAPDQPDEWPRIVVPPTTPSAKNVAQIAKMIDDAQNPVAIIGGSRWSAEAVEQFQDFARKFAFPVYCSFRRQMLFAHHHPNYAGDLGLGINPEIFTRINQADIVLLVGGRLSEIASQQYRLLPIPLPRQKLIHVHPAIEEIGKLYQPAFGLHADPVSFCEELPSLQSQNAARRQQNCHQDHRKYLTWSGKAPANAGLVQFATILQSLQKNLPAHAILTNGAGNYTSWFHRFWRFQAYTTQLAPTSGSMGYGLPAAIAAKLQYPDRIVLALAGDGCFQMTCQEFATAIQYQAHIILLLFDNGMYGTIRMHQIRKFPARRASTTIQNPDFALWAQSYGGYGATIQEDSEFAPAFYAAQKAKRPALLHIRIDPKAIAIGQNLESDHI